MRYIPVAPLGELVSVIFTIIPFGFPRLFLASVACQRSCSSFFVSFLMESLVFFCRVQYQVSENKKSQSRLPTTGRTYLGFENLLYQQSVIISATFPAWDVNFRHSNFLKSLLSKTLGKSGVLYGAVFCLFCLYKNPRNCVS